MYQFLIIAYLFTYPMYYIGVKDGKMENDRKNKSQNLGFLSQNILGLATLKVYKKFEDSVRGIQNLKTLALIEAEASVTEFLIGEKEKWTNNGNDKQEKAVSLLHNTTSYTQHFYPISKF